jgi:hypothetical protein
MLFALAGSRTQAPQAQAGPLHHALLAVHRSIEEYRRAEGKDEIRAPSMLLKNV